MVLSSLSSSTAPPRKGSPNYINIVYHHGSSDANNGRGMQLDQWEGSNAEDSGGLIYGEQGDQKRKQQHRRKTEKSVVDNWQDGRPFLNSSKLVLNELPPELQAVRAGSPQEVGPDSAYFRQALNQDLP